MLRHSLLYGKEKYPALTGIRAVGACIVFFDHFPLVSNNHIIINVMAFFYVLSGFLIFRIYYPGIQFRKPWLRDYFVKRFARIYPVYFLLLTVAVLLRHDFRPLLLLKNYTLTHALFNNNADYIIEPSWSLTVEECFYFLAPLLMFMMRRLRFLKTLVIGFLLLAIALWVSMLPLTILHTPVFIFSTTFFGHFFEFFAGIFIAMIVMKLEQRKKLERKGIRLTLVGTGGVVVLVAGMVFIYRQQPLNIPAIIVINNFLLAIPVAMMYLGLMREKSWLGGLLGSTLLRLLGRASYSFYLLHTIVIAYIGLPILQNYFPGRRVAVVIITFIATWIASILLYWFFEEPINKAIRKKTA